MAFCQVIVDIAHEDVDRVFTYRVPEGMSLCPGMRVHVPFGRVKRVEGVVVAMTQACDLPPERVRDVTDVLEDYPAVLPGLLRLAMRIRESSFCTLTSSSRESLLSSFFSAVSAISCCIILRARSSISAGMESISVRIRAQASSTRSIALSGRNLSVI